MKKCFSIILFLFAVFSANGCSTLDKAKRTDMLDQEVASLRTELDQSKKQQAQEITRLLAEKEKEAQRLIDEKNKEIDRLLAQKEKHIAEVKKEKDTELSELEKAKKNLESSLSRELKDYKAKLEMTERGLVITFLAEIFFDSGRDVIRKEAIPTLKKVTEVLNGGIVGSKVAVEGYTDNEPIQKSGWKSNWELSTARALAVVHNFIEAGRVNPKRLSAIGYGEFRPVASNDIPEGRQQNRRVEIVILPEQIEKIRK